jgi:hypothetical protein
LCLLPQNFSKHVNISRAWTDSFVIIVLLLSLKFQPPREMWDPQLMLKQRKSHTRQWAQFYFILRLNFQKLWIFLCYWTYWCQTRHSSQLHNRENILPILNAFGLVFCWTFICLIIKNWQLLWEFELFRKAILRDILRSNPKLVITS